MSRLGSPIIFEPVSDPTTLATIARKAIRTAIFDIARRMDIAIGKITLEDGAERELVKLATKSILDYGIRFLLEQVRSQSSQAFLDQGIKLSGKDLVVYLADGKLQIRPE